MTAHQGVRVNSLTTGTPSHKFEHLSGGYRYNKDPDWYPGHPAYRNEPPIGRDPGPQPRSRRGAPPRLGSAQVAVLAELAKADLTAPEAADRLGRQRRSMHGILSSLEAGGFAARRGRRPGRGISATIWGVTAAGRAALAAHQQEGAAS